MIFLSKWLFDILEKNIIFALPLIMKCHLAEWSQAVLLTLLHIFQFKIYFSGSSFQTSRWPWQLKMPFWWRTLKSCPFRMVVLDFNRWVAFILSHASGQWCYKSVFEDIPRWNIKYWPFQKQLTIFEYNLPFKGIICHFIKIYVVEQTFPNFLI